MLPESMKEWVGFREMKGCFQLGLLFSGADVIGRGPPTDQQGDGINEERFAGSGLPGQDRKPRLKLKTKPLYEGEIDNAQLGEHCGRQLQSLG
jgi:hypothetical protein